ncbi:MAG: hypothetical protein J2P26_15225 [Nocardiopsaceae bacterium]|nr:hypothetical protein [Nocardiopsaceae bacterium]
MRAARASAAPTAGQAGAVRDFKAAWEAMDIQALAGVLDPGARSVSDGGGLATAAPHPVEGGARIARYLAGIAGRTPGLMLLERTVNRQPGLVAQKDGVIVTVYAFDVAGDRIRQVWAVRNPGQAPALDRALARRSCGCR